MRSKLTFLIMLVVGLVLLLGLLMGLYAIGDPVKAQGGMFFRGRVAIDGLADEIQLRVQGYTTQTSSLLVLENSSAVDLLEVDGSGNLLSDVGAITVTDNVFIDGTEDVIQLAVQGYTTQTSSLVVAETSAGVDMFTVSSAGNTVISGTTDLAGDVSSSIGAITVTDNVMIDGAVDVIQLTIQGYTTQTVNTLVVEQSDGTDVFEVDDDGHITATTFTLDSVAFSGPITFGSDIDTTNGELIAHGIGTTPTAIIATPITLTFTGQLNYSVGISTSNATSFTVSITPTTASDNLGIYWMAGK